MQGGEFFFSYSTKHVHDDPYSCSVSPLFLTTALERQSSQELVRLTPDVQTPRVHLENIMGELHSRKIQLSVRDNLVFFSTAAQLVN